MIHDVDEAIRTLLQRDALGGASGIEISFEAPEGAELSERVDSALDAIYAAYGTGWDDIGGVDPRRKGLADEALYLSRLMAQLLPGAAEARGLLAHSLLRVAARGAAW